MVHKILSNVLYITVASYQDCYFVARNTSFNQLVYSVQCGLHHSVFNIFTAQELDTDRSIRNRMVVWYSLADIAICAFQLFTFLRTFIFQVFNLQFYCFCEKSIVELNDVSIRAVVGTQSFYAYFFRAFIKFFINIIEQSPIAGSPSVNTLFYVTNNEVTCIFSTHGFFEQHFKVLPLDGASILELVNHYMVELSANLFKDEWRIAILYQ